ncbi:MAG: hypothetical protein ACE5I1_28925 [bacterium]
MLVKVENHTVQEAVKTFVNFQSVVNVIPAKAHWRQNNISLLRSYAELFTPYFDAHP